KKNSSNIYYGYDCFDKFITDLKVINDVQKKKYEDYCSSLCNTQKTMNIDDSTLNFRMYKVKKEFSVTFWSHNGGRYDHFLLLGKLFDVSNIVKNNGI